MSYRQLGWAWVSLCIALAIHVADEATTDFLALYNPAASRIRMQLPWLPIPVFTFAVWLAGLIAAIILLFTLAPFAFRGARWFRPLAYFVAVLMIGNGVLHTIGSFYLGRPVSGVVSSPLLLIAAVFLIIALRKTSGLQVARAA